MTKLKPLPVWITTNCGKFLKRWEYQACILRNLHAGQEETVRTRHITTDWLKIGKGILSPCLFNFYAEYIMQELKSLLMKVKEESERLHEFSIFGDILSAALSQHHLLGFEMAQLEFHHLH